MIHTTWMNLKVIFYVKKSKTEMSTYCMIPFAQNFTLYKLINSNKNASVIAWRNEMEGSGERDDKGGVKCSLS